MARSKRSPAQAAQPRGDRRARIFIFQVQLDQRGEAQAQTVGIGLGKAVRSARYRRKPDSKSEPVAVYSMERTRSRRFSLRVCSGGPEEALQAAAQVGSLADIGLGLGIVAAKQKDGRRGRNGGECFRVAIGDELEALGQHEVILV